MKNIIIAVVLMMGAQSLFAKDIPVLKKADQELKQLSQKSKRDKMVKKLEKQLSPEKRAELINDIQNSDLPESQKVAMSAVIEAIDDSIDEKG